MAFLSASLRRSTVFALLLATALPPGVCRAQARTTSGGVDLRLFRPAVDSRGLVATNGSEVLTHLGLSFGLVLDAGVGVLPFEGFRNDDSTAAADAERTDHLVDVLASGTVLANVGVGGDVILGVGVPIVAAAGPDVTVPGVYGDPSAGGLEVQGIGDVTVHGKARLLRVDRDAIGLSAVLRVGLPTGDARRFVGEPGVSLWPSAVVEWRSRRVPLRWAVDVGYRGIFGRGAALPVGGRTEPGAVNAQDPLAVRAGSALRHDDALTFSTGLGLRPLEVVELVAEVYGIAVVGQGDAAGALSTEALLGVRFFLDGQSHLLLAGGLGLGDGAASANARAVLSFFFEPPARDRDGDGLADDYDRCPDDPEDHDDFADDDGCPDPDDDRDGVLDVDDECRLVPEDRDGDADGDGCPEGEAPDRDGDGLVDLVDRCPDEPEDLDGFMDEDGCVDPDDDGDGLLDPDDLCRLDPEDVDGFEDDDGCPDVDDDADGVLDVDDACRLDPEDQNGFRDEDGCPDGTEIVWHPVEPRFAPILFATDSARILPASFGLLDGLAEAIARRPELTLLEVQGHADDRASDAYNLVLTRDRAAAVFDALVERGVARSRLRPRGYGERCPVVDPRSPRAREAARRVEIKIVARSDGGPVAEGDGLACASGRALYRR